MVTIRCHDCGAALVLSGSGKYRHADLRRAHRDCSYASYNAPRPMDASIFPLPIATR